MGVFTDEFDVTPPLSDPMLLAALREVTLGGALTVGDETDDEGFGLEAVGDMGTAWRVGSMKAIS